MKLKKIISASLLTALSLTFLVPTTKANAQVSSSDIPSHVLVGYWHNFDNGSGAIKLRDVSPNFDVINLSFGEPTSVTSGDIRFTPFNATEEEFKSDVKELQSKGKKVILSIGGQNGQVQLTNDQAENKFVESVSAIIDKYGLDGLDIDFEGHSLYFNAGDKDFKNPTTPVIVNLIDALKKLTAKYGDKFVLTMAPETFFVQMGHTFYGGANSLIDSRCGSYLPVIYAMRNELSWLQVQYYNSGSINDINGKSQGMGSPEFYVSLADMLLTGFSIQNDPNNFFPPLRQDQVVIGVPSYVNAGNGFLSNSEVEKALNALMKGGTVGGYTITKPYPNLRGLMTWSINWDQYGKFSWSDYFRKYFNNITPPVNTLKAAKLSVASTSNGNYTLTSTIPSYNSATSYNLLEGNNSISNGTLVAGNSSEKTITTNITNKAPGTYKYVFNLSDGSNTISSNTVEVTVKSPGELPTLKAATISASTVTNGNFTINGVIPSGNSANSYKFFEGTSELSSGTLIVDNSMNINLVQELKNKPAGTYDYTLVLYDSTGKSVVSNKISVTIEKSNETLWAAWANYNTGDIVTYNGKKYQCRQPHLALPGWEPSNVPALWLLVN